MPENFKDASVSMVAKTDSGVRGPNAVMEGDDLLRLSGPMTLAIGRETLALVDPIDAGTTLAPVYAERAFPDPDYLAAKASLEYRLKIGGIKGEKAWIILPYHHAEILAARLPSE